MTKEEALKIVNAEADRLRESREAFNAKHIDNPSVPQFCDTRVSPECRAFAVAVLLAYANAP